MTIKLKEESNDDCLWAIKILANLARYTYTKDRFFELMLFIVRNGMSIHFGMKSAITALLVVNDTEAKSIETFLGKVDFLQLIGITQRELNVLKEDYTQVSKFVENMKRENPNLVTDMKRKI